MTDMQLRFTTRTMFAAVFFICYILAAFVRGSHLLGTGAGLLYAFVAILVSFLFVQTLSHTPVSRLRLWLLLMFAIPVSLAFTFPTYLNSDVQYFVDDQATDRNVRHELATLFASDSAFVDLGVSTTHQKIVCVEIFGELPTRADLDRLRDRLAGECPTLDRCALCWTVEVREGRKRINGFDEEVFPGHHAAT